MYGYGTVVFASTMTTVSSTLGWGRKSIILIAIMSALFPFGAFVGALIYGSMKTKYGACKSMCISDVIGNIGALITIIPFTPSFAIGRFTSGVATGLFTCFIPGYVFEISPIAVSGKTGSIFNLLLNSRVLLATLFGLAVPIDDEDGGVEYWWMFMFGFQALVYAFQLFNLIIFFKFEPKAQLYNDIRSFEEPETAARDNNPSVSEQHQEVSYSDLCTKKFSKMLRLAFIMAICSQFSGINGIIGYSVTLYIELGSSVMLSRVLSVLLGVFGLLGAICGLPIIDRYGRKTLFISGVFVMALTLALAGISDEK
jgi:MFS family permease